MKFQSIDALIIAFGLAVVLGVALKLGSGKNQKSSAVALIERHEKIEAAPEPKVVAPPAHTNMPPGYTLVCDLARGVYSAKWGHFGEFSWAWHPTSSNRQDIIERAWSSYNYERTNTAPKELGFSDYNWSTCD